MEFFSVSVMGSAIFAIISFLFYYYYSSSSSSSSSSSTKSKSTIKIPPKAGGAKPLIGHLHLMGGTDTKAGLPHYNLGELADRHGPIYTIKLGVRRALVVSDWEFAKELYTTHDVTISNRPKLRAFKHLGHDFAMFGFTPYGPYWRQVRKLIAVELLSSRRLEMLSSLSMSEIRQCSKDLYGRWREGKDPISGELRVDMKQWFGDLNLNVIFRMVAGKRFYDDGGIQAEEGKQQRKLMRDLFHYAGLFVPADALPYLGWLDIGGHEKKMKQIARDLDKIMDEWLAEHRQNNNKDHAEDFMDLMIAEMNRGTLQAHQYDADTVIKSTIMSLIAGATDTTAVMLEWMMALLLNHPQVLKKAQEEIDQLVGRERRASESDVVGGKLPYLDAIIKETFRLYPAGPLGGPREFAKDATVGGYHIPKGTWLIVNLWKMQRDPKVWSEDAAEFRPERFLSGPLKGIDIKGGQDYEIIPFGAGRRICPGSNFGIQMMSLVFASVLHAFDFSTVHENVKVDMTESPGMTNAKATPLDVLVSPRLPPHLYE